MQVFRGDDPILNAGTTDKLIEVTYKFAVGAALCVTLGVTLPISAGADDESRPTDKRWLPSASVVIGIGVQAWEGSASSSSTSLDAGGNPTIPGSTVDLQEPAAGDDFDRSPIVGINFELMTPELPLPLRPRFFAGGEILGAFGQERNLVGSGSPGPIISPQASGSAVSFDDEGALGQGSEFTASTSEATFGAYLGIAFPFEAFDRKFMIKPMVAWTRFEVDLEGLVSDAACGTFPVPPPTVGTEVRCNDTLVQNRIFPGFLRETTLAVDESQVFNGIGPGIDLEIELMDVEQFRVSLSAGMRFYRILGDQKVRLGASVVTLDNDVLGNDEARADFDFEMDDWSYRGQIGLRVTWIGL